VHDYCSAQYITIRLVNRPVDKYVTKLVKHYQLHTASFVREIVLIREDTLELPYRGRLSRL